MLSGVLYWFLNKTLCVLCTVKFEIKQLLSNALNLIDFYSQASRGHQKNLCGVKSTKWSFKPDEPVNN